MMKGSPADPRPPRPEPESLEALANRVCGSLPSDAVVSVVMEDGAAWIEATFDGAYLDLPDTADQPLAEQIDAAVQAVTRAHDHREADEAEAKAP